MKTLGMGAGLLAWVVSCSSTTVNPEGDAAGHAGSAPDSGAAATAGVTSTGGAGTGGSAGGGAAQAGGSAGASGAGADAGGHGGLGGGGSGGAGTAGEGGGQGSLSGGAAGIAGTATGGVSAAGGVGPSGGTGTTAGASEGGSAGSTGGVTDRTPPAVGSVAPAGDATNVALNEDVSVSFSEPIEPASITAESVQVRAGSALVEGELVASGSTVTFVPATSLALGTAYTVALSTGITDLAGNPLAAPVEWAFTTRDGAWGTAQTITDIPSAFSATYGSPPPGIAVLEDGRVMAVWASVDAAGNKLEWSLFVPGQGWSERRTIPDSPSILVGARLVSIGSGNLVALLQEHVNGGGLWVTRFADGLWASPVTLTASASLYTGALAGAANGIALAAWVESSQVWASQFTPAAGWSEPAAVNGGDCTPVHAVGVALNAFGEDIVAFSGGGVNMTCAHRGWSDPGAAATLGGGGANAPAVAIHDLRNGLVAYEPHNTELHTSRCPAGADCGAGSKLGDAERMAVLAMNGAGDAVALWASAGELRGSCFTGDAGWSPAVSVAAGPGNTTTPSLAVERSGNATAVWMHTDGTRTDIWASRYTAGQQWSTAGAIETDTSYRAAGPRVGVDAMGRATAVWLQYDATGGPKVMYNRFE